jgi:hypothetical protein
MPRPRRFSVRFDDREVCVIQNGRGFEIVLFNHWLAGNERPPMTVKTLDEAQHKAAELLATADGIPQLEDVVLAAAAERE